MADPPNNPLPYDETDAVLERVQELSWALLDEEIEEGELALLDNLLLSCDKARSTYIGCVQLHTELMSHFAAQPNTGGATPTAKSPVLGFLNAGMPPVGLQSLQVDDSTS